MSRTLGTIGPSGYDFEYSTGKDDGSDSVEMSAKFDHATKDGFVIAWSVRETKASKQILNLKESLQIPWGRETRLRGPSGTTIVTFYSPKPARGA